MNSRVVIGIITIITTVACAALVSAEPETKPGDGADSPRQALKAQDTAAQAGNVEQDVAFYQADNEGQKKIARLIAEGDVAVAKLQKVVTEKFGKDAAAAVVRAAGTEDAAALDGATEKLEGDHATVQFKNLSQPIPMIRSDGKWKISLSDWLKGLDAGQLERLSRSLQKLTTEVGHVADLVMHDKFRSGEGVRDRIQRLHDGLFAK